MAEEIDQFSYKGFLNAIISGNRLQSFEIINQFQNQGIPIQYLYENIIRKALYEVGELWESNKISVATEHLASAIVEAILNELYFKIISTEKSNKTVLVACVENEFHQIGIKMISDVFEMNGWNSNFLGANTPTKDLILFAKISNPDLLAISISLYFHLPNLQTMIELVRKEFPDLTILVGGQAFRHGGHEVIKKYKNVFYLPDIYSTETFIKNLNQNG